MTVSSSAIQKKVFKLLKTKNGKIKFILKKTKTNIKVMDNNSNDSDEISVSSLKTLETTITNCDCIPPDAPSIIGLLPSLVPVLTRRIKDYHSMFSLPLIGEFWEETLHRSLEEVGQPTTWKPDRSHAVGEDMRLLNIEDSRISCKSGQFIKSKSLGNKMCVKWNGSRSTKFPTLEEKIKHFCDSHDDWYFLLAKNRKFDKKYKLIVFPSSLVKVDQLTWSENSSGKQYVGTGAFYANIGKAMSAQLWTTFPMDKIPYSFDINCN